MKPTIHVCKITATSCYRDKMFLIFLLIFVVLRSFSKQKISGEIAEVSRLTLSGVSVLEKNTNNAVASNFDRNYKSYQREYSI